ncbi:MAG: phosphodiester glycosidase family protein [Lachnospiraceae bacterium]|nr:phosphodiester glycosidase family protein [Lachnospiraceae bacterium]
MQYITRQEKRRRDSLHFDESEYLGNTGFAGVSSSVREKVLKEVTDEVKQGTRVNTVSGSHAGTAVYINGGRSGDSAESGASGDGYYDEDGSYTESGYYDEDGNYAEGGYYDEDGNYVEGGYYDEDGNYVEGGYYDEDGNYVEGGYYDENGNYVEDGYYDENGNYVEGGYYDENGDYAGDGYYDGADDAGGYYDEDDAYEEDGDGSEDGYYDDDEYEEEGPYDRGSGYSYDDYEGDIPAAPVKKKEKKEKKNGKKRSPLRKVWSVVWRVLVFILVTALILLFFIVGAVKTILNDPCPSETFKSEFVSFAFETSALKWLPRVFLSDEEVDDIINRNLMPEAPDGTVSDKDLIVIDETPDEDVEPITLEELFGTTYHGYMMTIQDPSTVYVGIVDQFAEARGWIVPQFCETYGAIGGVNGGEFVDMGSYSYTAMPVGGVVSQGKAVFENNAGGKWNLVCMTDENKLLLLKGYSVQAAVNEYHVRDCVHVKHETGPFLIIDGEPLEVPSIDVYGGGKNPRTAIGQRADGAILMCVVDGRQASSLGATFKDMIDIMQEYGAVNAACLDGGTSTQMYYEGEIVNNPYSPTGPRRCPTAWLVGGGERK